MKRIFTLKIITIVILSAAILYGLHYYLYGKLYEKMWENYLGNMKTENGDLVNKTNYKNVMFRRVHLPTCGTCGTVCFENLHFINDSTLSIRHSFYYAADFNIYKTFINWPDTVTERIYTIKEDSFLSDNEYEYMLWSFDNDTFKLSFIESKSYDKKFKSIK